MSQNFSMNDDERELQMQRSIIERQNRELCQLRNRLAHIEQSCLIRSDIDAPDDASGWVKYVWDSEVECRWLDGSGGHLSPAPDLRPDVEAHITLPILDC